MIGINHMTIVSAEKYALFIDIFSFPLLYRAVIGILIERP